MLVAGSGISKISIFKNIYLENHFIQRALKQFLFEEMITFGKLRSKGQV
jgi:hypothetical protein